MYGTVNRFTLSELDQKVVAALEQDIVAAQASLQRYRSMCEKCRPMLFAKTAGVASVNVQAYGVVERGDSGFCPACNRCVYSDES